MHYLKRIAKNAYDNIIEDDYLEPITEKEVYLILQKCKQKQERRARKGLPVYRGSAIDDKEEMSTDANGSGVLECVKESYELDSVFRGMPRQCKLEELELLIRSLRRKLEQVQEYICSNHLTYLTNIRLSLTEAEEMVVRSQATRPKLAELRQHLRKLQQSQKQSEKVMQLRVRVTNIKSLLGVLAQMPDLNRLRVKELRSLVLPSRIKELRCYSRLQEFIQKQVDGQNERQISDLKAVLLKFDSQQYRVLLVRFFEMAAPGMELDKLILGISRQLIRQFDVEIYDLCLSYVQFMINYHLICRWHHEYKPQEHDDLPADKLGHLRTSIFEMRRKLWVMMEEHVQLLLGECIDVEGQRILQLTCQLNRFIEIGENFGGAHIGKVGEQLYLKSVSMIHSTMDKGLVKVSESLGMEESVEWSRMPVENEYRYLPLENAVLGLARIAEFPIYKSFTRGNLCFVDVNEKKLQNPDEDWSFAKFRLEIPTDAVRLRRLATNLVPCNLSSEVVICQSVIPVLKFYEQCSKDLFNLRLVCDKVLSTMFFVTDYYAYFVFITFKTSRLTPPGVANPDEQRFEKDRFGHRYPTLSQFVKQFSTELSQHLSSQLGTIKPSKQEKKMLRSRVVSVESFKYITLYLEFCLVNLRKIVSGVDRNWARVQQKLSFYEKLHVELSEIIYRDCLSKIAATEFLLNPLLKIRWQEEVDLEPQRLTLEVFIKDFNKKLKGLGKGQIPVRIIDQIFHHFCNHVMKSICFAYFKIRKMTQEGRSLLKDLTAKLQKEMGIFFNGQQKGFANQLNELITATGSDSWEETAAYAKKCAMDYSLSYRQLLMLASISRCADLATRAQIQKREAELAELVRSTDNL